MPCAGPGDLGDNDSRHECATHRRTVPLVGNSRLGKQGCWRRPPCSILQTLPIDGCSTLLLQQLRVHSTLDSVRVTWQCLAPRCTTLTECWTPQGTTCSWLQKLILACNCLRECMSTSTPHHVTHATAAEQGLPYKYKGLST